jgi:hypothetical protein
MEIPNVNQTKSNDLEISCSLDKAFEQVKLSLNRIGHVGQENRAQQFIKGTIRYGLQSVKIRVSLIEREANKTTVVIQATSDDIWGAAAQNATKRVVETISNLDNPGYKPNRLGINPIALVALIVGFIFVVWWIINNITK